MYISIFIYICVLFCIVSMVFTCNKKLYQQSEKAMKENASTNHLQLPLIALRKILIGNDKNNREKSNAICMMYQVEFLVL